MYNQIGLKTPRGSGTNGYVQRNLAFREKRKPHSFRDEEARQPPKVRVANPEILEHQRKRKVEVMLVEWAEKEEIFERYGQEEGEKMVAERRKILLEDLANGKLHFSGNKAETHQRNAEKEKRNASFKNALRIGGDYEAGAVFDPEVQERRKQKRYEERLEKEKERVLQQLERELQEKAMRHKRRHGGDDPRDAKRSRREGSYEDERSGRRERKRYRSSSPSVSSSRSRSRSSSASRSPRRRRRDSRSPSRSSSRSSNMSDRGSRSPRKRRDSRSPSRSPSRERSPARRSPAGDSPHHRAAAAPEEHSSARGRSPSASRSPTAAPAPSRSAAEERASPARSPARDDEDEDMYTVRSIIVIPERSSLAR